MKKCTCLYKAGCGRTQGSSDIHAGRRQWCLPNEKPPLSEPFTPPSCSLAPRRTSRDRKHPCVFPSEKLTSPAQRAAPGETSAHHVVAVYPVGGIFHGIVYFSTKCRKILCKPVKETDVRMGANRPVFLPNSWMASDESWVPSQGIMRISQIQLLAKAQFFNALNFSFENMAASEGQTQYPFSSSQFSFHFLHWTLEIWILNTSKE